MNEPAGDGVDLDAGGGKFLCQSLCKAVDAAFGSGVGNFHRSAAFPPDGRDVDDLSAVFLKHQGDRLSAGVEKTAEICVQHLLPGFRTHFGKKPDIGDPCVIDQDIQRRDMPEEPVHFLIRGHIT